MYETWVITKSLTFHQNSRRKSASKIIGSEEAWLGKDVPSWWPGGGKGKVNLPPGDRRFGRKEEMKKERKKERKF